VFSVGSVGRGCGGTAAVGREPSEGFTELVGSGTALSGLGAMGLGGGSERNQSALKFSSENKNILCLFSSHYTTIDFIFKNTSTYNDGLLSYLHRESTAR
jgi:hypothetical protein